MKTKAPTLRQFQAQFPTDDSCLEHIMRNRFGDRHDCTGCGKSAHYYRVSTRRAYVCEYCGHQVYPTAGTPFDRTRTPLRDWFFVMFLFCTTRNGVAAKEVERQLGVTYKTAWRMCHEIRKYMGAVDGMDMIGGDGEHVEIDETFIGGRVSRKQHGGNPAEGKTIVFGMMEHGGDIVTQVVPNRESATVFPLVSASVHPASTVHTDEYTAYMSLARLGYTHTTVNHAAHEFATPCGKGVNAIEAFWAQLKRGISGTHIHVSSRHLAKYLGEFEFRHNVRQAPHLMIGRLMTSFAR